MRALYAKGALVKPLAIIFFALTLFGCSSGQLDLYNSEGKKVGECTAGYDWHLYGVKHSVDWLLNWCAQKAIEEGMDVAAVSEPSILQKDYSYPEPAAGERWNKKSSRKAFREGLITEKEYGYILAYIENEFYLRNFLAQQQIDQGEINEAEYQQLLKESTLIFHGD